MSAAKLRLAEVASLRRHRHIAQAAQPRLLRWREKQVVERRDARRVRFSVFQQPFDHPDFVFIRVPLFYHSRWQVH